MDAALVIITLLSLGLTGALLVYAARLQREAQQRSEARVAALAAEIREATAGDDQPFAARSDPFPTTPHPNGGHTAMVRTHTFAPVGANAPAGSNAPATPNASGDPHEAEAPGVPVAPTAPEGATTSAEPGAVGGPNFSSATGLGASLFAHDDDRSSSWRRVVIGGVVAVVVLAIVAFVGGRGTEDGASIATNDSRPVSVAEGAPLELVALRHERAGATLTVSGVVRNPGGSPMRTSVSAVVFLFDRQGTFVTSGRAGIDYQALAAGEESPFVVTVPNAGDVGRYRVSFRTEQAIVPHVDRRQPIASGVGRSARRQ